MHDPFICIFCIYQSWRTLVLSFANVHTKIMYKREFSILWFKLNEELVLNPPHILEYHRNHPKIIHIEPWFQDIRLIETIEFLDCSVSISVAALVCIICLRSDFIKMKTIMNEKNWVREFSTDGYEKDAKCR